MLDDHGRPADPRLPGPSPRPPEPPRSTLAAALVVVAVLAGAALFVSGFTLGQRDAERGVRAGADRALAPFLEAYRRVTTEYVGEAPPQRLVEGAIRGMFETLGDPYSGYMTQQEFDEGLAGLAAEFEGIGAVMSSEDASGRACAVAGPECRLLIVRVLDGSPASHAGLAAGDVLLAVDGTPVAGRDLDTVVRDVRGPRGTSVVLTIERDAARQDVPVVRDVVRTEDVSSEVLADGQIGYLRVEGFSSNVADDFRAALQRHLEAGIDRIVVDLRGDPGGYVDAAVGIASQFIASGPVFWEQGTGGRATPVEATGGGLATDPAVQVAVLVDRGSASASEILAGALRDTGRATIVGETSYGKGSIQQWHMLPGDGGGVRISIARWLTPDRHSIDGVGIVPDVAVPAAADGEGDPQLDAAVEVLLGTRPVPGVSPTGGPDASAEASGEASPARSVGPSPGS